MVEGEALLPGLPLMEEVIVEVVVTVIGMVLPDLISTDVTDKTTGWPEVVAAVEDADTDGVQHER